MPTEAATVGLLFSLHGERADQVAQDRRLAEDPHRAQPEYEGGSRKLARVVDQVIE